MKKQSKLWLGALVGLILIGLCVLFMWQYTAKQDSVKHDSAAVQTRTDITYANDGKQVDYAGKAGGSALEVLKTLTDTQVKDTQFGTMVTGIHGVKAVDGKSYWAFYVNGAYANEGASTYMTKSTDTITWKLEEIR